MLRMATARRNVLRITVNDAIGGAFRRDSRNSAVGCDSRIGQYPFLQKIVPCLTVYLLSPFLDACGRDAGRPKALGAIILLLNSETRKLLRFRQSASCRPEILHSGITTTGELFGTGAQLQFRLRIHAHFTILFPLFWLRDFHWPIHLSS